MWSGLQQFDKFGLERFFLVHFNLNICLCKSCALRQNEHSKHCQTFFLTRFTWISAEASVVFKRPYDFNLTFRDQKIQVFCSMFAFFLCDACLKNVENKISGNVGMSFSRAETIKKNSRKTLL